MLAEIDAQVVSTATSIEGVAVQTSLGVPSGYIYTSGATSPNVSTGEWLWDGAIAAPPNTALTVQFNAAASPGVTLAINVYAFPI